MSGPGEATIPATRRPRRSAGGHDKENATVDVTSVGAAKAAKKSRSKSMGPGGLDVLKSGTGNRRVSLAAPARPPPRSILKPTIPLLPEIPPHKPKNSGRDTENGGDGNAADAASPGKKIAVRTEEEQQAAVRKREEQERAQMESESDDRREARRKSLANRRVSFAAEATLHTFHEVEYLQDSTTSTDSTRRASSVAALSPAPSARDHHPGSDASEPPSTPPEQAEATVKQSPANQRDSHQKKRRRSSGVFNNADDDTINTSVYSSDSEHGDDVTEIQAEEDSDSSQDSDEEDGTMMTLDAEEMTSASIASARSGLSNDSTNLDENLRLAAQRAGTQQLDMPAARSNQYDDGEEVIPAFKGWIKKGHSTDDDVTTEQPTTVLHRSPAEDGEDDGMDMDMDMDMTSAVGGIIRSNPPLRDQEEDMSMDVTSALGGIISRPTELGRRQSVKTSPQKQSTEDSSLDDETMDLTVPVGGMKSTRISSGSQVDIDENEDMSMELTTVVGGVLSSNALKNRSPSRRRTILSKPGVQVEDAPMDMTVSVGRILSSTSEDGDATVGMDMTVPLGRIIKPSSPSRDRSAARKVMEAEADGADPASATSTVEVSATAEPNTSRNEPNLGLSAFRGKGLRRSPPGRTGAEDASSKIETISKNGSPSKMEMVSTAATRTPTKTPPSKMIGSRSTSPQRQAPSAKKATPNSPSKKIGKASNLFKQDPTTGATTPLVVLTPQRRRLSGLGVDRPGLGSPKVAEILGRRDSIGDAAADFIPSQGRAVRRAVAFEDPRAMEEELDRERQRDEDKENHRKILEREADGSQDEKDATLNLREMIQGLSPKKGNISRARKSLHVGSAKGLLGKRPAELDDDDDEDADERDGIKRLKGHQGSPVKNVRLQSPPSKAETTGRPTRATRRTLAWSDEKTVTPSTLASPHHGMGVAASPKRQGRFKDVEDGQLSMTIDFDRTLTVNEAAAEEEADGEGRIHLQDFLNMTSIRFMELTTTKRRHTIAPKAARDSSSSDNKDDLSLERCVVAGACTVPMLELFQHSCRELKKYISEGRRIVKEIETETFEENPPLFREYMSATPDFKGLMDAQFKNVKTHARLLSKAMWYEWRTKLQEGLKEGLVKMMDGMTSDDKVLGKQQALLDTVVPDLVRRFEELEREHGDLELVARELADCDPGSLLAARSELVAVDGENEAKRKKIAELQLQLRETEESIEILKKQKQDCFDDIKESEKVREECRGWSSSEVAVLKAKVEALEKQHGWAVTGTSGTTVSMTYRRGIELVLDVSSFQPGQPNSRIDLWYIAAARERDPQPATPEQDFLLQCMRDRVRALPQCQTKPGQVLALVSAAWDKAAAVARQVRLLRTTFHTDVVKTSDTSVAVRSSILLAPLATRVEAILSLHCRPTGEETNGGVEIAIVPQASVVYGEQFNAAKMAEFLATRVGPRVVAGSKKEHEGKVKGQNGVELWVDVLVELQARLLARGKK